MTTLMRKNNGLRWQVICDKHQTLLVWLVVITGVSSPQRSAASIADTIVPFYSDDGNLSSMEKTIIKEYASTDTTADILDDKIIEWNVEMIYILWRVWAKSI